MSQKVIVTTSPWKDYKTGKWMLSAVMNIQLDASGNSTLVSFADVLQWMDKLQQTIFFVQWGNTSPVEIKPKTDKWNPALYTKLFHDKIKVDGFAPLEVSKLILKSYPVMHVANFVMDAYKEVGNIKMNELPKAAFYTNDWKKLDAVSPVQLTQTKPLTGQRRDAVVNDFLKKGHAGRDNVKQQLAQNKVISYSAQANANTDFGQFQNFHSLGDKNLTRAVPQIKQPDFEYHDILSIITSYPIIMRKLGLIIDFELPAAPAPASGTVRILPANLGFAGDVQVSSPATAYESTASHFFAASKPGSFISRGMLKVNSPDFSVVTFDTDAAAMKLTAHADAVYTNVAKLLVQQTNYLSFISLDNNDAVKPEEKKKEPEEEKEEGMPALRSAGIGLVKNGLAQYLNNKLSFNINIHKAITNSGTALKNDALFNKPVTPANTKDPVVRKANVTANTKAIKDAVANAVFVPAPAEILYADDLVHGYRMDIAYEEKPNTWYSLHKRKNTYEFAPVSGAAEKVNLSPDEELDEGCIHLALTKDENDEDNKSDKVNEVLARWEGWSLSVPKPGKGMNDGDNEFHINTDEEEKKKYKLNNEVPFRLQVNSAPAPKTLPMLRFGKSYKLKVRTVDIAGNGLPHDVLPDNAAELIRVGIKYLRYEPLPVPLLVQADEVVSGDKTKMRDRDGESLEHMVIRSNVTVSAVDYEKSNPTNLYKSTNADDKAVVATLTYLHEAVRHLKAPRTSQHISELHGMFDESFASPAAAKETYNFITSRDAKETKDDGSRKAPLAGVDKDNLPIDYLADPLAAGVIFTMKTDTTFETSWKKDTSRRFSFYFNEEMSEISADKPFSKADWRNPKSFRIKLAEGTAAPAWNSGSRMLTVFLPKSARIEIKYASLLRPQDVDGYTAMHGVISRGVNQARASQFTRSSLHWMITPWRTIRLVHAVQQPLEKPTTVKTETAVNKEYGSTFATISTKVNVHGSSTDKIDVEARWTQMVDDLNETAPKAITFSTHVDTIPVDYTDRTFYCNNLPGRRKMSTRAPMIKHPFGDTKHRMVEYDLVATTRYREYFTGIIETFVKTGKAYSLTQTGFIENPQSKNNDDLKKLNILSSARPAAPVVDYIVPSFNWIRGDKGNEMVNMRTGNIRVYLKRPWYSSGDGEKLAVLLPIPNVMNNKAQLMHCTVWGKDPVFNSPELNQANYPQKENFPFAADYDTVTLPEDENSKMVIAAYNVLFDEEKQLHYADIPVDIKQAYFPFVRLCLARYQRNSIRAGGRDCCLSNTVTVDWLQIVPVRYTALYFKGGKNVFDVALRGTASFGVIAGAIKGLPENQTKCRISITIENTVLPKTDDAFISVNNRPQGINTTLYIKQYDLRRDQLRGSQIEFVERITLDGQYASQPFRVVIREYELHESDPIVARIKQAQKAFATSPGFVPEYTERLVFMDVFEVNGSVKI
jgi:hypothetical protein